MRKEFVEKGEIYYPTKRYEGIRYEEQGISEDC
jgi:hypothetical protein